jgi:lysozyme family protein
MDETFDTALRHVLQFEGGYSDHPHDPGGATNLGITHRVLETHRGRSVSKADVRALTRAEATQIYRQRYWNAASCPALPPGLDLAVFDCAVNQGVARATRLLQQAANVKADGVIGPITLAAIRNVPIRDLINEFMARRMNAYGRLQQLFRTFGLGWSRRLVATHAKSLGLLDAPSSPDLQIDSIQPPEVPMSYIFKRLQEPSTYAGIAAVLAALGLLGLTEHDWNQIFGAIAAVAGAVAILIGEAPKNEEPAKPITLNDDIA